MTEKSTFFGTTEKQLRDLSTTERLAESIDHRKLFPNQGHLWLESGRLVLEGWTDIPKSWIVGVSTEFTDAYSRLLAGGVHGQGPILGVLAGGKPLILHLARGKSPIYLLIEHNWLTGTNKNEIWGQHITDWLNKVEIHG